MQNKAMKQAQRFFATGLSLITSTGPAGSDVMAAEWTMQVSYEPMLIAVFIHDGSSTLENIKRSRCFGVNVASEEQATLVSIAGGFSRKEVDKLGLDSLFTTYRTRSGLPMIKGCVVNAECLVHKIQRTGDHEMVIGRVYSIRHDEDKKPLIYHRNRYFGMCRPIEPERRKVRVSKGVFDAFSQQGQTKFITKATGVVVRSKNMILTSGPTDKAMKATIPFTHPKKGSDYKEELGIYLSNAGLKISIKGKPRMCRLLLQNNKRQQRLNIVLFDGTLQKNSIPVAWVSPATDSFLRHLLR